MLKTNGSNEARRARGARGVAVLTAASLLTAACATKYGEGPQAKNVPADTQRQPQSLAHWQSIAERMAAELKPAIGAKSVFVASGPASEADFPQVFRGQLQAALLGSGVRLVRDNPPRGEQLVLDVAARLVRFSGERAQSRGMGGDPPAAEGARDGGESWYDSSAARATPPSELVLSVSLRSATHVVGHRTQVFHVAEADRALYEFVPREPPPQPSPPQVIRVTGGR